MHSIPFHLLNPASCGVFEIGLEISHKKTRNIFSSFLENFWVKSASSSQAKNTAASLWSSTWKGFLKVTGWDRGFELLRFTLSSCSKLLCVIWLCSPLPWCTQTSDNCRVGDAGMSSSHVPCWTVAGAQDTTTHPRANKVVREASPWLLVTWMRRLFLGEGHF